MLAYDGASSLDVVGPLDVLAGTQVATQSSRPYYQVELVSLDGGLIATNPAGLKLETRPVSAIGKSRIDILIVTGGENAQAVAKHPRMKAAVLELAERAERVASVCTGAFLLAEAGLLCDRHATTHWRWTDEFRSNYPSVTVDADRIFVNDGKFFSSAGITAGMDLALALIEVDFGPELALSVAQNWVMFLKRPGGQSQFSSFLPPSKAAESPISGALDWAKEHLNEDLSVEALADHCGMSPRNFARRFHEQMGCTPSKYVENLRLQAAKGYLESTPMPLARVAAHAGFQSADHMRRSFLRHLKVNPQDYRERFRFSDLTAEGGH